MRYRQLPVEQIIVTDQNIRKTSDPDALAELEQSISMYGLLQPVLVFETGEDEYRLIAGHRRLTACTNLEWDAIPAMVTKSEEQATILAQAQENLMRDDLSLEDEFSLIAQLTENSQREDVDPKDEGEALLALAGGRNAPGRRFSTDCDNGCPAPDVITCSQLATMLGKCDAWVKERLRLLDLPPDVRQKVTKRTAGEDTDGISFKAGLAISRLKDTPDTQRALADKVEREKMTRQQTEKAVRAIKADPDVTEAVLKSPVDDSTFDHVTAPPHDEEKLAQPAKKPPQETDAEIIDRNVSEAYKHLLRALDEDRVERVEGGPEHGLLCASIAEKLIYTRNLIDGVIHRWNLERVTDTDDGDVIDAVALEVIDD